MLIRPKWASISSAAATCRAFLFFILMNQTTRLEWGADEGTQAVLLRIYVDGRRTSAYIPVAYGKQDGNVSESVWQEAQAMYEEEFRKPF